MKTIRIKVLKDMANNLAGDIVSVPADDEGTPKDFFWQRRLKDAKIDGCCEIVKKRPAFKAPVEKTTEEDV